MSDRQDYHDILGRQPTILRDVAVLATGQHEFPPTDLRHSTHQGVIRKKLACRPRAYFDARRERARGRRGFFPATLSAKYSNVASREWALPLRSASRSDSAASAADC
jgi:hypothetical protein